MKKIMKKYFKLIALLAVVVTLSACSKEYKYNPGGVTGVSALYAPADGYYVELASGSGNEITFDWEAASAEDGASPLYEIVFYSDAAGTSEIERVSAGAKTTRAMSHKDVNSVMNTAGVEPDSEGSIYWSIISSRGITVADSKPDPRLLIAKRMKGFKVTPDNLYLVGSATETGDDISLARKFATLTEGEEYEIFTSLTQGEYNVTDGNGSDARYFNVTNGVISEDDSTPITCTEDGLYRIIVELTSSSVTIEKIENFVLKTCSDYSENAMTYVGGGVWQAYGITPNFANDDRYFFRADIGGVYTKIGSVNWDNSSAPASSASVTWDTQIVIDGDSWGYSYKVISEYRGNELEMNAVLTLNETGYSHTAYFTEY